MKLLSESGSICPYLNIVDYVSTMEISLVAFGTPFSLYAML
jgi:hypothetical protein